jgi:hypothetical protein
MPAILSTTALVGLFAGAALLLRPSRCPRCRERKLHFEKLTPGFGRDRCGGCGWEAEPEVAI